MSYDIGTSDYPIVISDDEDEAIVRSMCEPSPPHHTAVKYPLSPKQFLGKRKWDDLDHDHDHVGPGEHQSFEPPKESKNARKKRRKRERMLALQSAALPPLPPARPLEPIRYIAQPLDGHGRPRRQSNASNRSSHYEPTQRHNNRARTNSHSHSQYSPEETITMESPWAASMAASALPGPTHIVLDPSPTTATTQSYWSLPPKPQARMPSPVPPVMSFTETLAQPSGVGRTHRKQSSASTHPYSDKGRGEASTNTQAKPANRFDPPPPTQPTTEPPVQPPPPLSFPKFKDSANVDIIGMQPDSDPKSKRGVYQSPLEITQRHPPNPARTLVVEQLPKSHRGADFITAWARRASGAPPIHVEVNKKSGKALVEFSTSELARAAWGSPRLKETPAPGKKRSGIHLIRVWWYRVEGVGAGAGVGELEEGEIEGDDGETPVAKETKKDKKARLARERAIAATEHVQEDSQPKALNPMAEPYYPSAVPVPMDTSITSQPWSAQSQHYTPTYASFPHVQTHTAPYSSYALDEPHASASTGPSYTTTPYTHEEHDHISISSSRPGSVSPPASPRRAASSSTSPEADDVRDMDVDDGEDTRAPATQGMVHTLPAKPSGLTRKAQHQGFSSKTHGGHHHHHHHHYQATMAIPLSGRVSLSSSMMNNGEASATPIGGPASLPGIPVSAPVPRLAHVSNNGMSGGLTMAARLSDMVNSSPSTSTTPIQISAQSSSSASASYSRPKSSPSADSPLPSEPRAMKNAPKGPSFNQRSLAKQRELEARIAKNRAELEMKQAPMFDVPSAEPIPVPILSPTTVPGGGGVEQQPVPGSVVQVEQGVASELESGASSSGGGSGDDRKLMEERLRSLVLASKRAKAKPAAQVQETMAPTEPSLPAEPEPAPASPGSPPDTPGTIPPLSAMTEDMVFGSTTPLEEEEEEEGEGEASEKEEGEEEEDQASRQETSEPSSQATSPQTERSPSAPSPSDIRLDDAVSFINQAIFGSQPAPGSGPNPHPPAVVILPKPDTKADLAAKQRQLEQQIAESKILMQKLSSARTKVERDAVLKLMREQSRRAQPEPVSLHVNTFKATPSTTAGTVNSWTSHFEYDGILEISDDEDDD